MVTENGQCLGGNGPRRDMKYRRSQFSGDFEHVGDHQQQTLAGGKGRGQCSGLQCAMYCTCRPRLRLHLCYQRHGTPDVFFAIGTFNIRKLPHVGRRSDGVDGDNLVGGVGHVCCGCIAVDGNHFSRHA